MFSEVSIHRWPALTQNSIVEMPFDRKTAHVTNREAENWGGKNVLLSYTASDLALPTRPCLLILHLAIVPPWYSFQKSHLWVRKILGAFRYKLFFFFLRYKFFNTIYKVKSTSSHPVYVVLEQESNPVPMIRQELYYWAMYLQPNFFFFLVGCFSFEPVCTASYWKLVVVTLG